MVRDCPAGPPQDSCRACLASAVIGLDQRLCHGDLAGQVIKKQPDVIMQRALVSLQRQRTDQQLERLIADASKVLL